MLHVEDVERAFELSEGKVVAPIPEDGRVAHVDHVVDGLSMRMDSNDGKKMMVVKASEEEEDDDDDDEGGGGGGGEGEEYGDDYAEE